MAYSSAHDVYLESRIMAAEPLELIRMLYHGAIGSASEARRHLAAGRIADRSAAISKTCEIIAELASSLDHEQGGEISERLAQLYDYMQYRLVEANIKQADEPLAEVMALLGTLVEAWDGLAAATPAPAPAPAPALASPWQQAPLEPALAPASAGWSF
jgi:flagellar secretion chaperone FliS